MRETEVDRFVPATVAEVEHAVDPEDVISAEGSFEILDVEELANATLVTAGARGLQMTIRFERRDGGLYYEQEDDAGPFEAMWTRLAWTAENEGTRVTARSGVSLGLPLSAVTDRVAAWKRRGELRRMLDTLAENLG